MIYYGLLIMYSSNDKRCFIVTQIYIYIPVTRSLNGKVYVTLVISSVKTVRIETRFL